MSMSGNIPVTWNICGSQKAAPSSCTSATCSLDRDPLSSFRERWEMTTISQFVSTNLPQGFPCGSAGKKKIRLWCRRPRLDLWVGKIPWGRERLPIPVFCHREFHGLYSPWGCKELDTTEQLSLSTWMYLDCNFCLNYVWYVYFYIFLEY